MEQIQYDVIVRRLLRREKHKLTTFVLLLTCSLLEAEMKSQSHAHELSYLPVAWEYREIIETLINEKTSGKIFYFDQQNRIDETAGQLMELSGDQGSGMFVTTDSGTAVRIDRIITIFGKLGAAYDEYNAFSSCGNGCDPEDSSQGIK